MTPEQKSSQRLTASLNHALGSCRATDMNISIGQGVGVRQFSHEGGFSGYLPC
jgi:hypothetical protein